VAKINKLHSEERKNKENKSSGIFDIILSQTLRNFQLELVVSLSFQSYIRFSIL